MSERNPNDISDLFAPFLPAGQPFTAPITSTTPRHVLPTLSSLAGPRYVMPALPDPIQYEKDLRLWEQLTLPAPDLPAPEPSFEDRMRAVNVRPLTDEEVIDHGGYVELKEFPHNTIVYTGHHFDIDRMVCDMEAVKDRDPVAFERHTQRKRCAHPSKAVRLKGWHKLTLEMDFEDDRGEQEVDYFLYFSVGEAPHHRQGVYALAQSNIRGGYIGRSAHDLSSFSDLPMVGDITRASKRMKRITDPTDIPGAARQEWIIYTLSLLQRRSYTTPRAQRLAAVVYARAKSQNHSRYDIGYERTTRGLGLVSYPMIHHRGRTYSQGEVPMYRRDRADMRELGVQLANMAQGENFSPDEFDDYTDTVSTYSLGQRMAERIVEVWNAHNPTHWQLFSCGHIHWYDEGGTVHDGEEVCQACLDEDYTYCSDTSEYHHNDDVYEHSDGEYRTYPEEDDDDDYYDEDDDDDYEYPSRANIRGYNSNVLDYYAKDVNIDPSSYGEFLMGIELEVVPTRDRIAAAIHTHENLCDGYAIMKDDSSLHSGGFEIVTAPRGITEHVKRFKAWEPYNTLRAWDPGCCGLHTHISSQAFTAVTLGKFVEFINADYNQKLITRIAGRHPISDDQSRQFCRREGDMYVANPKKTMEYKSTSRYTMVNTANLSRHEARRLGLRNWDDYSQGSINTVELRIFRASLNKNRMLAQIEFAHAAVNFCRWASMRQLTEEHFTKWLKDTAGIYPHLAKWYGVKANRTSVAICPKVLAEAEV